MIPPPVERCPSQDDGWGEFAWLSWYGRLLRSGRRLDCSASFFWSHSGRATQADPGEKRDTAKTSNTRGTDSQKELDLNMPNREDNPITYTTCW